MTYSDKLIVALDLPSVGQAKELVDSLDSVVSFYKVGLELFVQKDYFNFIEWLLKQKKKVFVDLKLFDIPQTVKRTTAALIDLGVHFVSVHGNDSILKAAIEATEEHKNHNLSILAVTVLTSLDEHDINSLGFECSVEDLVYKRACKALELGCCGIVSSGLELKRLKQSNKLKGLTFVCPGIRPVANIEDEHLDENLKDDQKRIVSPYDAFRDGADYIVVGRPIRDSANPKQAAINIQNEIRRALE